MQNVSGKLAKNNPMPATASNDDEYDSDADYNIMDGKCSEINLSKTKGEELKNFLKLPHMTVETFLTKYSASYPRVADFILQTLCIPATSVPCERLFSHAEFQVT